MRTGATARFGLGLVILLVASWAAPATGATWSYSFDNDLAEFSGTDGWESQYCTDKWTTALNGGVTPKTDDGCNVDNCSEMNNCGYNWGYWLQWGQCVQSDPLDNHLTYGPKTWTDYVFRADMRNDDDDTFGFVFRYQNSGQFYLFLISRNIAPMPNLGCGQDMYGAALYRIEGSDGTVLGTADGVVYQPGQIHKVQISVIGDHITVEFDANHDGTFSPQETVFDLDDPDPLDAGQVGFFAWENGAAGGSDVCSNGGCWFDNAEVDVLSVDDPCDGISWEGYCDGDTAVYCDNGEIQEVNCDGCCAWLPNQEYYWCTNGPACQEDCIPECDAGDFGCSTQGTHGWVCEQDSTGCWLRAWTACTETGICDPATGQCEGQGCEPQCVSENGQQKECGADGCGGSCGTCQADSYCSADFICVGECVPNCTGKICGSDGCDGSCGTCPAGFECSQQGQCQAQCLPNCVGKQCGDDGCGGSCGLCPPGLTCVANSCTTCEPDCAGKQCGDDGCGGLCGTCPADYTCEDSLCVEGPCDPLCVAENGQDKQCGPDGCGGFCGFCPPEQGCSDAGMCISTCVPDCDGKECGPDGCDGFCGQCDDDAVCWEGQCLQQDSCVGLCGSQAPSCFCDNECDEYGDCCDDVCDACPDLPFCSGCVPVCPMDAECGYDGCGGTCGVCDAGFVCQDFACVPDGPIVPQTCGEIQFCIDACETEACAGECFEVAPSEAQQLYFETVQCYQNAMDECLCDEDDENCETWCVLTECRGLLDECYELEGDCGDIWTCIEGCQSDACMDACLNDEGDANAKLMFLELLGCVEEVCIDGYTGCYQDALEGECAGLLEDCVGEVCEPECEDKECGDDGCGGICGICDEGFSCLGGECIDDEDPCVVACAGKECGSTNGCLCGTCGAGETCDDGQCAPVGECIPAAYKSCVDGILYWFDSCDEQGPPAEICKYQCVDDQCVNEDPGTGDVVAGEDAGDDSQGNDDLTVFPTSQVSSGCSQGTGAPASTPWIFLLALVALFSLGRVRPVSRRIR